MTADVVAIDGPAGVGKSTTARAVADALGFGHLDSGALYRAFTLATLDHELPPDGERIAALGRSLPVRLALADGTFRPEMAGVDVSQAVRRPEVTARVSEISALPAVRTEVTRMLREAAASHPRGVVIEGRDIGTVVFPDARLKVFLTAQPRERARRRLRQEGRAATEAAILGEAAALTARDTADAGRSVAPLRQPPDAHVLDTTELSFQEQVEAVVALARNAFP